MKKSSKKNVLLESSNLKKPCYMIDIYVSEFYNRPEYFPFMPATIFNALEQAFIDGDETARVSVSDFDTMMDKYKQSKTKQNESNHTNIKHIVHPTAVF